MKKIILVFAMLIGSLSFAQESSTTEEVSTKDQLIETLKPYVEKLLQGIEKGAEMASQEIPEIIMQFVIYSAVSSWLWVILGLVFIIFNRRIRRAIVKLPMGEPSDTICERVEDSWGSDAQIVYMISKIVFYIAGLIMFFNNIGIAIKATFLPKLFLVEKFIELVQ